MSFFFSFKTFFFLKIVQRCFKGVFTVFFDFLVFVFQWWLGFGNFGPKALGLGTWG